MAETTNTISRDSILFGIIGLLAGSLITIVIASNAVNNNMTGMMKMMGMHTNQQSNQPMMKTDINDNKTDMMHGNNSMTMDDMTNSLKGKTGDEFDKAFLSEMIVHHQGAIDMASLAKQNAKHDEIKSMAEDIISAQTKEINQMEQWYKTWGY